MSSGLLKTIALAAVLWAGARAGPIMYDARSFVFGLMENDAAWADHLNAGIRIDVDAASPAARRVLRDVGTLTTDEPAAGHRWAGHAAPQSSASAGGPGRVVVADALLVVAEVATGRRDESDALEFALSAVASAVKCNALRHVLVQLRAVEAAAARRAPDDGGPDEYRRMTADVRRTMIRYVDALARLKEPLDVESEMYRLWLRSTGTSDGAEPPGPDDLLPVRRSVDDALRTTCELSAYEEIVDRLKLDPETENLDTAQGARAVFDRCQRSLDDIFERIPVGTMDPEIWDSYLG